MDDGNSPGGGGERVEEGGEGVAELEGGVKGRLEVGRELDGGVWVRGWGGEGREGEIMEVDGGDGVRIPPLHADLGLAVVGGGAYKVDGEAAGGEEAREVEELV